MKKNRIVLQMQSALLGFSRPEHDGADNRENVKQAKKGRQHDGEYVDGSEGAWTATAAIAVCSKDVENLYNHVGDIKPTINQTPEDHVCGVNLEAFAASIQSAHHSASRGGTTKERGREGQARV